jgi:hypothetical protein
MIKFLPWTPPCGFIGWSVGALLVTLFLLPLVSPLVVVPKLDEFIVVYDSQRVLDGAVPYRDFFNFILPGTFYALAACFTPFGLGSLTIARYATVALILLNWSLLYLALRRSGWSSKSTWVLSMVYPICVYPFWPIASHHWLAHLACMGFLVVVSPGVTVLSMPRAFILGIWVGFATCVLQTEALILGLAGATLVTLAHSSARERLRKCGAFILGSALLPTTLYLPLVLMGAGGKLWADVVLWPSRNYSNAGNDNARFLLDDVPIRLQALWSGVLGWWSWPELPLALAGSALYVLILLGTAATLVAAMVVLCHAVRFRNEVEPLALISCLVTFLGFGLFLRGRPGWQWLLYLFAFLMVIWLVTLGSGKANHAGLRKVLVLWGALALAAGFFYQSRWIWYHWPTGEELTDVDRPVREDALHHWLRSPGGLKPEDTLAAFPEGGEFYLYGIKPALGYTFFTPLAEGLHDERDQSAAAMEIQTNQAAMVLMPQDKERLYLDPRSAVGRLIGSEYERRGTFGLMAVYSRRKIVRPLQSEVP